MSLTKDNETGFTAIMYINMYSSIIFIKMQNLSYPIPGIVKKNTALTHFLQWMNVINPESLPGHIN